MEEDNRYYEYQDTAIDSYKDLNILMSYIEESSIQDVASSFLDVLQYTSKVRLDKFTPIIFFGDAPSISLTSR